MISLFLTDIWLFILIQIYRFRSSLFYFVLPLRFYVLIVLRVLSLIWFDRVLIYNRFFDQLLVFLALLLNYFTRFVFKNVLSNGGTAIQDARVFDIQLIRFGRKMIWLIKYFCWLLLFLVSIGLRDLNEPKSNFIWLVKTQMNILTV